MEPVNQSLYCAESVRKNDPDRYLLAMMAPSPVRAGLFALYAFNVEVARTRELVSEPPLGEIRLQWWRDEIEALYAGGMLRHGISGALRDTVETHELTRASFDRLIDARSADLDDGPPATIADLLRYSEATTGPLLTLALEVVGDRSPDAQQAARHIGTAWSLAGLVRALPYHLRARRQYLPRELTRSHGVKSRDLLDVKPSDALNQAVRALSDIAAGSLREARSLRSKLGRKGLPVLLQARFAEMHLQRLESVGYNPFDPQLAVPLPMAAWRLTWAKLRGRY
ncbi:MAG: phytoene/squalene synthase family protein [Rhodospirillaceae bacterium]|nr:phytoene/squalene synthase family protein [Rhodospirillaceae bacterium]